MRLSVVGDAYGSIRQGNLTTVLSSSSYLVDTTQGLVRLVLPRAQVWYIVRKVIPYRDWTRPGLL
jgi:hypothetical protein